VSEAELQKAVIELAKRLGWRTAHFRPGMTKRGNWVTAVQGDGKGFPDLVLARDGVVLFVELKAAKGRLSMDQLAWLSALTPERMLVWRPMDWNSGAIEATLRNPIAVAA
jgi:hypothetical protein